MNIKDLKITTKFAVSVASFLLPLGILLFYTISISSASMQKNYLELRGIEVLRPLLSLKQIIPYHIRLSVDNSPGDINNSQILITDLLIDLDEKYTKYFGSQTPLFPLESISDNWNQIINFKSGDSALSAYRELMGDITRLTAYIGDISGLFTDSDLENAYLVVSSVYELPQAQLRIVQIDNFLRILKTGTITQEQKEELRLQLSLLNYSDNNKIYNRYNTIEILGRRKTENLESFEHLLQSCHNRINYLSMSIEQVINNPEIDISLIPILHEVSGQTNNAIYRLQSASLDRLETLITARIKAYQKRFLASLGAAVVSTVFVLIIIISTVNYIRISAKLIHCAFVNLDNNDLSVELKAVSRDEMGQLTLALNGFLKKINKAFISFNNNANMVTDAVYELSISSKEIAFTANEQQASISEIVSTMQNNNDLSIRAAEKTNEVAQLASHTQELSRRGAQLRDVNEDMMLDIRDQNNKIIEIIKNLADMLSRIDESTQLIDTIADRTKLIAFNAALEASSSGEAGSRFSVVAGEIRRFADNVADSVSEIKEKIKELQEASQMLITEANSGSSAIDAGYKRMVEQKEVFENIVDVSKNVANRSQQISSLSKQQEMASAQVFTALKEISHGVGQFVTSTAATSATLDKLNSMSIELKETLAEYKTKNRKD